MRHLRASAAHIDAIGTLVTIHGRLVAGPDGVAWTDGDVRRLVRDAAVLLDEALLLTRTTAAHLQSHAADRVIADVRAFEQRMATLAAHEDLGDLRPALDGAAVMQLLGLEPGRQVGAALEFLAELRLEAGPIGIDEATGRLRQWWIGRST
jgi:poly(A) polymerase